MHVTVSRVIPLCIEASQILLGFLRGTLDLAASKYGTKVASGDMRSGETVLNRKESAARHVTTNALEVRPGKATPPFLPVVTHLVFTMLVYVSRMQKKMP